MMTALCDPVIKSDGVDDSAALGRGAIQPMHAAFALCVSRGASGSEGTSWHDMASVGPFDQAGACIVTDDNVSITISKDKNQRGILTV
jgi:hypothetical protein